MSTRHLFLPFLVALAGFVSCDEFKPEVAVGCVTVDNEYSCALTSAIGGETDGNQKWAFYDEGKVRVNVSGYKCRCGDAGHIPFTLTFIDIDLPGIATMDAIWRSTFQLPCTVKRAATSGFLSPSHFIRIFKENAGCTPARWRKVRIQEQGQQVKEENAILRETLDSLLGRGLVE